MLKIVALSFFVLLGVFVFFSFNDVIFLIV